MLTLLQRASKIRSSLSTGKVSERTELEMKKKVAQSLKMFMAPRQQHFRASKVAHIRHQKATPRLRLTPSSARSARQIVLCVHF
jgi:hypothetical protein